MTAKGKLDQSLLQPLLTSRQEVSGRGHRVGVATVRYTEKEAQLGGHCPTVQIHLSSRARARAN